MEYITSRGFALPTDKQEMENGDWFNMWERKQFPYLELLLGDTVYWFETNAQRIVWETQVIGIKRYPYTDKSEIFEQHSNPLGGEYYDSRPQTGYFIDYKVKVIQRLDVPKPLGFTFPQLGWLRVDREVSRKWFDRPLGEDGTTLDDNVPASGSVSALLTELSRRMQEVSPKRIKKVVATTIRRDTPIVKALKKAADYKCQFPACGQQIKKRDGTYYVEVAHIEPVHGGGKSVLGNLIVLCPNHHKEFDYGDRRVDEDARSVTRISGTLNGKPFDLRLAS